MRLAAVIIENFRCYRSATRIEFEGLTMLVGKNDAGKSSILEALSVFFDQSELDSGDRSVGSTSKEISIACEFDDLPASVILDSDRPTSLSEEYLLNSSGRLVIRRVYNGALAKPKLIATYAVADHPSAPGFDALLQMKNSDLKTHAKSSGVPLSGVDTKVNPELRRAIWKHATTLSISERDVLIEGDGVKAVWSGLAAYLPQFALFKSDRPSTDQDSEAQDPMKTAIQEALRAKQAELDALSAYVESEVSAVAALTLAKLREMDPGLASGLSPQVNKTSWASVFKVSLTDQDAVPINKRGSGIRRLILVNFFRAKAERVAHSKNAPGVIYALEEPETSQHPSNQRLLLSAFRDLAAVPGNQVILTSHTPVLARLVPDQSLRYVTTMADGSRAIYGAGQFTNKSVTEALGVLPDHNVRVFVGVEGKHDIEFFVRMSAILAAAGEDVPDLGKEESAGRLVFIPLGGSNLQLWVSRLSGLERPEVYFFDRDTVPPAPPKYQDTVNALTSAGKEAYVAARREIENFLHPDAISGGSPVQITLPQLNDYSDIPNTVAQLIHAASGSPTPWGALGPKEVKEKEGKAKTWLNRAAVDQMTPARLTAVDPSGQFRDWLRRIGTKLVVT